MKTRGLGVTTRKASCGISVSRCKEVSTQTMLNMDELDRIMLLFLCPRTEACTQTEGTCLESLPVFNITLNSAGDNRGTCDDSCGASGCPVSEMSDDYDDCNRGGGDVYSKIIQDNVAVSSKRRRGGSDVSCKRIQDNVAVSSKGKLQGGSGVSGKSKQYGGDVSSKRIQGGSDVSGKSKQYGDVCGKAKQDGVSVSCKRKQDNVAVSSKRKPDGDSSQTDATSLPDDQNDMENESPPSGKSPTLTPRTSRRLAMKRKLAFSGNAKLKSDKKSSDLGKRKSPACKTKGLHVDEGVCNTMELKEGTCSGEKGAILSIVKSEPGEQISDTEMSSPKQDKIVNDSEDQSSQASDKNNCDGKYTEQPSLLQVESKKRLHTCKFCSRTFRDMNDFMRHNRMHTKEKPYPCEQCDNSFRWKASYLAHLQQVHQISGDTSPTGKDETRVEMNSKDSSSVQGGERSRRKRRKQICKCEFCGKVLRCLANLNRHMLTHTGTRPFPCNQCPRAFSEQSGLKNHILRRHSEKQHVCDLCGKHFGSILFLKQHIKVHTKQREEYVCKLCEKVYTTTLALDIHMLVHSGLKPFVCDHCGKKLYSKYQLNRHVKRHLGDQPLSNKKPIKPKSHICNICSKAFASSARLTRHMSTVHSTVREQQCPTCNKMFSSVGAMKKHMREHNEGPYQCEVCERWWLTKETYNTHMRLHFGRTSSKVFVCVHCNMGFFQMLEVDDHYKSHAENANFRCMHCEKSFEKQEDLVTHRSVHPNQKVPLNCDRCDKLFATLQELRAHEQCHDKPLECVVCDLKFTTEEEAKEHMQSHTDDGSVLCNTTLMYKCPRCGKLFTNKDDYNSHALVHDGAEFVCTICDFAFETSALLESHLSTHTVIKVEAPEVLNSITELREQFDSSASGDVPHIQIFGPIQLQNAESLVTSAAAAETLQTVIQYETVTEEDVSVCHVNYVQETISCTVCGKKFSLIENFLNHCQDHPEIEVRVKTV